MIALYMLKPLEGTIFWKIGTYALAVVLLMILFTMPFVLAYALIKALGWAYRIVRTERRR